MAKNPFKKQSIVTTITNTAIGGAGNVAFDYVWDMLPTDMTDKVSDTIKNAIKLVGGAVAGSMVTNKYLRAMTDGFAVVGASDLVSGLITSAGDDDEKSSSAEKSDGAAGLPAGTIGRIRRQYGSPDYARRARGTRGTNGLEGFME